MKVKEISAEVSAKVPMQDYGSMDLTISLTAEIVDGEDVAAATQELATMMHHNLEQLFIPAISNKLSFHVKAITNWPQPEQDAYWNKLMVGEGIDFIKRSGVVSPGAFDELINGFKVQAGGK